MPFYQSLFRALDASGTRYVVVGGVAVVLHGYARLTADVDLVLDLERDATVRIFVNRGRLGTPPLGTPAYPGAAYPSTARENTAVG